VSAREINPPQGVKAIEWFLLINAAINSAELA